MAVREVSFMHSFMKVDRKKIYVGKRQNEDVFVKLSASKRLSFIWELTAEVWSLRRNIDVERRLQRNVTNLVKK